MKKKKKTRPARSCPQLDNLGLCFKIVPDCQFWVCGSKPLWTLFFLLFFFFAFVARFEPRIEWCIRVLGLTPPPHRQVLITTFARSHLDTSLRFVPGDPSVVEVTISATKLHRPLWEAHGVGRSETERGVREGRCRANMPHINPKPHTKRGLALRKNQGVEVRSHLDTSLRFVPGDPSVVEVRRALNQGGLVFPQLRRARREPPDLPGRSRKGDRP